MKKALKDRGISVTASAKKPDLIAKLKDILTASTASNNSADGDDDFEQQLADITEGKTGVLQVPTTQTSTGSSTPSPSLPPSKIVNKAVYASVTGSSFPRTGTTNTSTTSTANGASAPNKLSTSTTSTSSSSSAAVSSVKTSSDGNSVNPIKKVTTASTSVHPLDKLAARAARFGSVEESKAGSTTLKSKSTVPSTAELDALKKRSERFGESVSTSLKSLEEKEKLALRASRFNLPGESTGTSGKATIGGGVKRLTTEEDEKLKKRRERFGLN